MEKNYVMIVTGEDERYETGEKDLLFFIENPYEGLLQCIRFFDTKEELYEGEDYEGLFYIVYDMDTGRNISQGTFDPDYPRLDIEEWERENKVKRGA